MAIWSNSKLGICIYMGVILSAFPVELSVLHLWCCNAVLHEAIKFLLHFTPGDVTFVFCLETPLDGTQL